MRKRDMLILLLSGVALMLLLQQEGNISLEKSFVHLHKQPKTADDSITHEMIEHEVVDVQNTQSSEQYIEYAPKPIIADLDGDGIKELLVASRIDEGRLPMLRILSLRKLLHRPRYVANDFTIIPIVKRISFTTKRSSQIAIVGMATGVFSKTDTQQKIVVVFSNWKVVCFDHNLKLVWDSRIVSDVSAVDLQYHFDRPSEVVVSLIPYSIQEKDKGIVVVGLRKSNYRSHDHRRKNENEKFEESTHYSYYAFDGATGVQRWRHESKDFQFNQDTTIPQHNYKIDLKQHTQHSGEVHWRHYRDDLLRQLPHLFRHPHDTRFAVDHFQPMQRKRPSVGTPDNVEEYGEIREKLKETFKLGSSSQKQHISQATAWSELSSTEFKSPHMTPNVVVAHLAKGIEVIHLYTGRTLCQVAPLKSFTTFADLNMDGTIESAEATSMQEGSGFCLGVIESGAPSNPEVQFKTSICEIQRGFSQFSVYFSKLQDSGDTRAIQAVPPAIIEHMDGSRLVRDVVFLVSNGLTTCVTLDRSSGEYKVKWQVSTPITWGALSTRSTEDASSPIAGASVNGDIDRDKELGDITYPEIVPLALRKGEQHSFIVLAGDSQIAILDHFGTVQHLESLPFPPTQPMVIGDINGDRINDIVIATKEGYYGYTVRTHSGTSVLSVLVIGMLAILCVLYMSTFIELKDESFVKNAALKQH